MASTSLLNLLRRGPSAWNEARINGGPDETLDLCGADLSGPEYQLQGVDFSFVQLDNANLCRKGLSAAKFFGARLNKTNLSSTHLIRRRLFEINRD